MSSEQDYSLLDRMVHRLAFSGRAVQLTAADIEATIWGNQFREIPAERPVFITSLPRAGTTLLLEVLSRSPNFASHLYREMPFILAPLLWGRLSGQFRRTAVMKERAHGDGMAVGYDSPEAFEEVLWRFFWPEKYRSNGILPWSEAEEADEFKAFFVEHMQKLILVRTTAGPPRKRYVSKNNANIARIGLLKRLFPDGFILVPFRHPVDQATSLMRQHEKFLALHRREPFSKRYMNDIGHLEFGELHRPILFDGAEVLRGHYRPDSLDYWLAYWVAAFEHILRHENKVILMSYERMCEDGARALAQLADCLQTDPGGPLTTAADLFKTPIRYDAVNKAADRVLLQRADALHCDLLLRSVV